MQSIMVLYKFLRIIIIYIIFSYNLFNILHYFYIYLLYVIQYLFKYCISQLSVVLFAATPNYPLFSNIQFEQRWRPHISDSCKKVRTHNIIKYSYCPILGAKNMNRIEIRTTEWRPWMKENYVRRELRV